LKERIKDYKKRVSEIVKADGRSKRENNKTSKEVQEKQYIYAEIKKEVI
jgi:hypothetical protein